MTEAITHPPVPNGHLLIQKVHRALLLAPPHQPWLSSSPAVPLAYQIGYFRLQRLGHGLQPQLNQRSDQSHSGEERCQEPLFELTAVS